jgi:hypothetical protein
MSTKLQELNAFLDSEKAKGLRNVKAYPITGAESKEEIAADILVMLKAEELQDKDVF